MYNQYSMHLKKKKKKKKKKLTRLRIYVKDKTSGLLCYNIQPDLTSFILL